MEKRARICARLVAYSTSDSLSTSSPVPWLVSSLLARLPAGGRWLVRLLNSPMKTEGETNHGFQLLLHNSAILFAICFAIIGGLRFSHLDVKTYSDEIAWLAVSLALGSVAFSFFGIRNCREKNWPFVLADLMFIGGLATMIISVLIAVRDL
jgi:cytochrome bd-type quinol oxidase subunit 2